MDSLFQTKNRIKELRELMEVLDEKNSISLIEKDIRKVFDMIRKNCIVFNLFLSSILLTVICFISFNYSSILSEIGLRTLSAFFEMYFFMSMTSFTSLQSQIYKFALRSCHSGIKTLLSGNSNVGDIKINLITIKSENINRRKELIRYFKLQLLIMKCFRCFQTYMSFICIVGVSSVVIALISVLYVVLKIILAREYEKVDFELTALLIWVNLAISGTGFSIKFLDNMKLVVS